MSNRNRSHGFRLGAILGLTFLMLGLAGVAAPLRVPNGFAGPPVPGVAESSGEASHPSTLSISNRVPDAVDAFAHFVPNPVLTATVGTKFTIDLFINSGSNTVVGQQSYMTFTNSLLQVVNTNVAGCVASTTVNPDLTTFNLTLQNTADNAIGEIAYASGTFGTGAPPSSDFRVAQISFCASAIGDAVVHWQFSPPAPANRNSKISDSGGTTWSNPALYVDGIIHVIPVGATATSTSTAVPPTATLTNTPVAPTATLTTTPVPPTSTSTTVPSTATTTNTAVPPTATVTNTAIPPSFTSTQVPPTSTGTGTSTNTVVPLTSTSTGTSVPATATTTTTPVLPSATSSSTQVPATGTLTSTPVPPTVTRTNTASLPTTTATQTQVVPSATRTSTPGVPTTTSTSTSIPPTATGTSTGVATATRTNTPAPAATPSNTALLTSTPTRTALPSSTATNTVVATSTNTALLPTTTHTGTTVPTGTRTNTPTAPTATQTGTAISTASSTSSPTSPTATETATTVVTTSTSTATETPSATSTVCSLAFSDVPPDQIFYTWIRCLACRGIISGYDDGTFRPFNDITRGQISKIVSNSAGFDEDPGPQIYEDVTTNNPFYVWINRLSNRGFMGGYPCGTVDTEPCNPPDSRPYFRPFSNATRGQLSKIVSNAAGVVGTPTGVFYTDVQEDHPFYTWIMRLTKLGVMSGYDCGGEGEPCDDQQRPYFRPYNNVTRGQASKIVANTFFPGCATP